VLQAINYFNENNYKPFCDNKDFNNKLTLKQMFDTFDKRQAFAALH
jgi:hypothetical protein